MKMFLISDNVDTYTGMRLAGVDGVVVHERDELRTALEDVLCGSAGAGGTAGAGHTAGSCRYFLDIYEGGISGSGAASPVCAGGAAAGVCTGRFRVRRTGLLYRRKNGAAHESGRCAPG